MKNKYPENSPEENYALIMCGNVFVNGEKVREPERKLPCNIEVIVDAERYVSRGALKLRHAIEKWNIPVAGKVFLDAGCSTGGFTDYLLKQGAAAVHAVDVGYNQLDYSLRKDSRVIVHERTNIMDVMFEAFNPPPAVGCADLSFRSITRAASKILELVTEKTLIALVKPQFETERENLVKGVVTDSAALQEAVSIVIDKLFTERAFVKEIISSPIQGRKGNREFLFLITGERCVEPDKLKESLKNLLS